MAGIDDLQRLPLEQQETMARILDGLMRLAELPDEKLQEALGRLRAGMEVGDGEDVDAEQD
jgi:hypothetical protein